MVIDNQDLSSLSFDNLVLFFPSFDDQDLSFPSFDNLDPFFPSFAFQNLDKHHYQICVNE